MKYEKRNIIIQKLDIREQKLNLTGKGTKLTFQIF